MARGYGLDTYHLRSMVEDKLQEHPDLFYYIEDPYIKELADLILDCVIEVVDENNKKYMQDLLDEIYRLR
jgi:predicted house-cleaning noncanonical NTP pyrophosphatase (MazG superfamily)